MEEMEGMDSMERGDEEDDEEAEGYADPDKPGDDEDGTDSE